MKKLLIFLTLAFFLQSCSTMPNKLDCPMKGGIRCESIDSINARVDRGELGGESNSLSSLNIIAPIPYEQKSSQLYPSYTNGQPLRYGETVMRVWFSPYEDKEGNYHQESEIYTITKPGHWIGNPVKSNDIESA